MANQYSQWIGKKFPQFALKDDEGNSVDNNSISQRWSVFFFYPKDDTPGCTIESCAFRDHYADFKQSNAVVYGVSEDSIQSHTSFRKKYKLPYHLLCDENKELYTSLGLKKNIGLISPRVTFVVDQSGIIRNVYSSQTKFKQHAIRSLKIIVSKLDSQVKGC